MFVYKFIFLLKYTGITYTNIIINYKGLDSPVVRLDTTRLSRALYFTKIKRQTLTHL